MRGVCEEVYEVGVVCVHLHVCVRDARCVW